MDNFLGQIILFAGNFAIRGYALCEGQLLSISANSALFSLLGTTYGGDGRTTFGLPDLRGRVPIGPGTGPGLHTYSWGQRGGTEFVTLNMLEIPSHNHGITSSVSPTGSHIKLSAENGVRSTPQAGDVPAVGNIPEGLNPKLTQNYGPDTNTVDGQEIPAFNPASIQITNTGGSQPHENRSPFLAMYYQICMTGIYPSRH